MGDPTKLFDIFKTKSDADALAELNKFLKEESDISHWAAIGLKQTASTAGFTAFGATANDTNHAESSLFQYALELKCYQCASLLLEKVGLPILYKSNVNKENGFHTVAKLNHEDFRSWFFNQSCLSHIPQLNEVTIQAVNQITSTDQHVLTLCYNNTQAKISEFQAWIKLGANPALLNSKQGNMLHVCCEKDDADSLKLMLDQHADLMLAPNDKRQYPAHIAAGKEHANCLQVLIDKGSPLTIPDKHLNRPLHHAIAKGSLAGMMLILKRIWMVDVHGEQVSYANVPNAAQERPLHLLIIHNKIFHKDDFDHALALLLQYGADLYALNGYRQTPMQLANDFLKDNKIIADDYDLIWKKTLFKQPLHLFSRTTLFARVDASVPQDQAAYVRQILDPVFQNASLDPIAQLNQDFCWVIEQLARKRYAQTHPAHLQGFLSMFAQLQQDFTQMQKQQHLPLALLAHQWQTPVNNTSEMQVDDSGAQHEQLPRQNI